MKGYLSILKCKMSALLRYRSAVIAGVLTQLFWGMIKVMVLQALYAQTTSPQPLSLAQTITFIWISQAAVTLLPWDIDQEIEGIVKSGNIASFLIHPIDLYWLFFFRSMANRLVPTLLRAAILIPIAALFLGLSSPMSWGAGIACTGSLILSALLSAAITAMILFTLFWTLCGDGIQRILPHFSLIFSGMVIPLPLFPDWLQPILNIQPLRGIVDIPCRIYTGVIPLSSVPYYYGFQIIWFLFFVAAGRWLMRKALTKIEIHGG